jgi:predicted peroxiredoxin
MKTYKFVIICALLIPMVGCVSVSSSKKETIERIETKHPLTHDGVLIHISSGIENPHKVLMALQMANIMSANKNVLVYFDIKGVNVVLNASPDLTYKHFLSSKTQLLSLTQKKNVTIMVCPGCLKAVGYVPKDVMPGIQIADKEKFFNFTDGRIVTLDY